MTPEQVEKVRGHLGRAKTILTCRFNPSIHDIVQEVHAALAALDGEPEEVVIEIHGGQTLPDGRLLASFFWPPAWPMLIPQKCRLARAVLTDKAGG